MRPMDCPHARRLSSPVNGESPLGPLARPVCSA